uniref:FliG_C domain-containing protein n=1 Tax=Haemonchus contortus TaxID=6289 RepID=A0A7I4Z2L1_HAECO
MNSESGSLPTQQDFSKLSVSDLMRAIMEKNPDPIIGRMLVALREKIPEEMSDAVDEYKRSRSSVISGLEEASPQMRPSERQTDLKGKVRDVLDSLAVECRPVKVYRSGNLAADRPRLAKIVLSSEINDGLP